jgi:hypothetical protein
MAFWLTKLLWWIVNHAVTLGKKPDDCHDFYGSGKRSYRFYGAKTKLLLKYGRVKPNRAKS